MYIQEFRFNIVPNGWSLDETKKGIEMFFSGTTPEITLLGYYGRAGFKLSKEVFFSDEGLGSVNFTYNCVNKRSVIYNSCSSASSADVVVSSSCFGFDRLDHIKETTTAYNSILYPLDLDKKHKFVYASNILSSQQKRPNTGIFQIKKEESKSYTKWTLIPTKKTIPSRQYYDFYPNVIDSMCRVNFLTEEMIDEFKDNIPEFNPRKFDGAGYTSAYGFSGASQYEHEKDRKKFNEDLSNFIDNYSAKLKLNFKLDDLLVEYLKNNLFQILGSTKIDGYQNPDHIQVDNHHYKLVCTER